MTAIAKLVLKMTSNTTGSYVASSPAVFSGSAAWVPFSGQAASGLTYNDWFATTGSGSVMIDLGASNGFPALSYHSVAPSVTSVTYSPTSVTFSGSNDGTNFTTIDTQSSLTFTAGIVKMFAVSPSQAWRYYRWSLSNGGSLVGTQDLGLFFPLPAAGGTPLVGEGLVF